MFTKGETQIFHSEPGCRTTWGHEKLGDHRREEPWRSLELKPVVRISSRWGTLQPQVSLKRSLLVSIHCNLHTTNRIYILSECFLIVSSNQYCQLILLENCNCSAPFQSTLCCHIIWALVNLGNHRINQEQWIGLLVQKLFGDPHSIHFNELY